MRPDFAEATLMHIYRGGSVRDHLLTGYRNSFAAVVLRQLQDKGFRDGMQVRIQSAPFTAADSRRSHCLRQLSADDETTAGGSRSRHTLSHADQAVICPL